MAFALNTGIVVGALLALILQYAAGVGVVSVEQAANHAPN
jgi:hypothetical protein